MKSLIMVAGFLWLMAATAGAQMSRDVLDAMRAEVTGDDVPKLIKVLHDVTEFDEECDAATRIVVAYRGDEAHVFLVVDGKPCAVVTGPADGVRRLLLHIQGQPT